jgi:hypothetical protein
MSGPAIHRGGSHREGLQVPACQDPAVGSVGDDGLECRLERVPDLAVALADGDPVRSRLDTRFGDLQPPAHSRRLQEVFGHGEVQHGRVGPAVDDQAQGVAAGGTVLQLDPLVAVRIEAVDLRAADERDRRLALLFALMALVDDRAGGHLDGAYDPATA